MKHQRQNNTSQQRQYSGRHLLSINVPGNSWSKQKGNTPIEKNNLFAEVKEPVNSIHPIMYSDDRDDW